MEVDYSSSNLISLQEAISQAELPFVSLFLCFHSLLGFISYFKIIKQA